MTERFPEHPLDDARELAARARAAFGEALAPPVAHLRVAYGARILEVLFSEDGAAAIAHEGLLRSDWRSSPLAPVLLRGRAGEPFQVGAESGVVLARRVLRFEGERLIAVRSLDADDRPAGEPGSELLRLPDRPRETRARSLLDVQLDAAQRRAVELPDDISLLVLGEAGHGKTTVALHRMARLASHARAAGRRFLPVVIVPTEGLRALLEDELRKLGEDVPVLVYEQFASLQGRHAFTDLPRRESAGASVEVPRLKRDAALLPLLEERARVPPGRIDDDEDAAELASRAHARRSDLQHLFGDREILERIVRSSALAYPSSAIDALLAHTTVQFSKRTEAALSHVDHARLVTVDQRSLDDGTPLEDAESVDVEDHAVLYELDRLRAAALGKRPTLPRRFHCIVLDEAQELAPIELRLVGRSLARGGTLIVAGDASQQLDPSMEERPWEAVLADLGVARHEEVRLALGYRCAPDVVRAARHVLWGEGPRLAVHAFGSELAAAVAVADAVAALATRDPAATIGVIARTERVARRLWEVIAALAPCRLTLDGRFGAGRAHVTSLDQVRGLELDFVLVPDADARSYPDEPRARRALYLAITRARHAALLCCAGAPTPLAGAGLGG